MSEKKFELLACPFCGYEPAGIDKIKGNWSVICLHCEYSGPPAKIKDAAILFWNTRNTPSAPLEEEIIWNNYPKKKYKI